MNTVVESPNTELGGTVAPFSPQRIALVILGMHRSGTSAVAGCVQRAGVEFGPRLMPATDANERGYYEHIDIVNLHDRLLLALDRGWDSTTPWPSRWWEDEARIGRFRAELLALLQRDFATAPLWSIKDPRLCRLLPWWRPLWSALKTEPVFLIVVRDPREVAVSLARREGISRDKSYFLWLQHLLEAEKETRGCKRCFLNFADFMDDWAAALSPLAMFLGPTWHDRLAGAREANAGFLDSSLRRASAAAEELGRPPSPVEEVSRMLTAAAASDNAGLSSKFDALIGESDPTAIFGRQPLSECLSDLRIELSATRKLARWYEAEWHKSARRALKSESRKKSSCEMAGPPVTRLISNDNNKSYMRNHILSLLRKAVHFLPSHLRDYFR